MRSGLRPRKSLGQHFLRDERIARRIVESMAPAPGDAVLEIGPGDGALTKFLAASPAALTLVELDERAIPLLLKAYGGRAAIIQRDILDVDLAGIAQAMHVQHLRIAGNIPYNITTPIIFHVLDQRHVVRDVTIMMQKDVARRLAASEGSKEYGVTSVIVQMLAAVELLFDVQPGSFSPRPEVTSSVLRFTMRPTPLFPLHDEPFFRSVVRTSFGKRRKTLRNSLASMLQLRPGVVDADTLARRPEELTLEEFAELANALYVPKRAAAPVSSQDGEA